MDNYYIKFNGGDVVAYDASFKTDAKKNPIILRDLNHVESTINILFRTVPGVDEYEPLKGLNIKAKLMQSYVDSYRDLDYETDIVGQISKYTDFEVSSVVALFSAGRLTVTLGILYNKQLYTLITGDSSGTLEALIN